MKKRLALYEKESGNYKSYILAHSNKLTEITDILSDG